MYTSGMDYRTKLQEIITASGLSQQLLADKIGTSLVSLNNWLNGKSTPTRKVLLVNIDNLYAKYSAGKEEASERRIKYYGLRDLATSFYLKPAMKLLDDYEESKTDYDINDILELYNVLMYVENLALPRNIEKTKLDEYVALKPKLHKSIVLFFNAITEVNALTVIKEVDFNYHDDLLTLLARYKRYDNISAGVMLRALKSSKIAVWSLLANREIVDKYDEDIRVLILSDPDNAEQIVHKYLEKKERREVHMPPSFTKDDARSLLEAYINNKDANPNYLQLIATARVTPIAGIDDKIKLLAKRKHDEWTDTFFKESKGGVIFGCEVAISDSQEEAVEISNDQQITKFTYSKKWLEEHSDNLSSLSNFIHLFPLANKHMILTLPSYSSQLGVVERFMKVAGREEYAEGIHFQFIDQSTLMQTMMYEKFLRSQDKELEDVIAWFFNNYLKETFGADGFNYTTSSKDTTYLEKCGHIFSEMDGIIKQFELYAKNGSIDQDLLSITSKSLKYEVIPSQVTGKYAYTSDSPEIFAVMHYLFSDQSGLGYINEDLKGKNFVDLLANHEVKYSDFHDHQKHSLDELIKWGIVKKTSKRLIFTSERQILILKNLFQVEALSYYHYTDESKAEIDSMVSKGWLVLKESLLTAPEAKYFNFYLNQESSSNGKDLRNIYIHRSMSSADKANENIHYQTYIIALRLFIALIIKIDDDFSAKLRLKRMKKNAKSPKSK
jgi:transcriptional regulator with XRE-family HTH domain